MNRPKTGDRINNYLLDERAGSGGFSEVWKAHHHVFNDVVAVKIPTDSQYVRYLQRDGVAIHGLQHPNIVRAIDLDPYADPPYLIMEYVDGPSLRQLIDRNPQGLPKGDALIILSGVLSALEAAHAAGLIHRDIKPANILIAGGHDLSGLSPDRIKVADFGLGRQDQASVAAMLQSGSIALDEGQRLSGTLAYMAPEQREGRAVDVRTDVYAAGVVLHEMLTGTLPQGADPPSSIRAEIPRWIDEMFQRCYTHRDRRFPTATDMRAFIDRHWTVSARTPPPLPAGLRGTQRSGDQTLCTACRGVVSSEDQFCIHCGRQMVAHVPRCPTCHAFVARADNFCILCGTDLRRKA